MQVVDPVEHHVDRATHIARERNLAQMTARIGDARDLASCGTGYDAVLLLGPLYHLTERGDRLQAFAEAIRVAKPGGVVVAVGISRFASLIDGLKHGVLCEPALMAATAHMMVVGSTSSLPMC